jgi:hypothetical protein
MDRDHWTKALREAERELEAATTRIAVKAAAKKADARQSRAEATGSKSDRAPQAAR